MLTELPFYSMEGGDYITLLGETYGTPYYFYIRKGPDGKIAEIKKTCGVRD